MKVNQKHLAIVRMLQAPNPEKADLQMTQNAIERMSEKEQEDLSALMILVGHHFTELMEDLDAELEKLADVFPDETDPRKWSEDDFMTFELAILGHEYEHLWRTYARQQDNRSLVWAKILERIDKA